MALILERTVQNKAQEFLEKKYRRKAKGKRIFSKTEMPTKKKYGSKRADGFLAFRHFFWGNYVVSVEAKSQKTLPAMRPYRDEFIMVKNCLTMGFYCCLGSGAFFALFKMDDNLFNPDSLCDTQPSWPKWSKQARILEQSMGQSLQFRVLYH